MPIPDPSERLFHYTNAAGLMGILRSQTIWASDTNGLNDSSEVIGSVDQLIECFENRRTQIADEPEPAKDDYLEIESKHIRRGIVDEALKHLRELKNDQRHPGSRRLTVHVASFSEDGDSNPLWDKYVGEQVEGYSIAFKPEALTNIRMTSNDRNAPLDPHPRADLVQVRYGKPDPEYFNNLVDDMVPGKMIGTSDRGLGGKQAAGKVLGSLASVKTNHSVSDKEWRSVFIFDRAEEQVPPLLFRSDPKRRLGLIPYVEIPFGSGLGPGAYVPAITAIALSPYGSQPEVRERGLRSLLDSLGMANIEIWHSESPAR